MIDKEKVLKVLEKVVDPELGINVVDLGLIYDIELKKDFVRVKMTLTSPFCPLGSYLIEMVKKTIKNLGVKKVDVEIVFDPPWSPDRMSEKARKILGI